MQVNVSSDRPAANLTKLLTEKTCIWKKNLCGLKKTQALGFPFQWWADIPPEYHLFKSLQFAIQLSVWRVHLTAFLSVQCSFRSTSSKVCFLKTCTAVNAFVTPAQQRICWRKLSSAPAFLPWYYPQSSFSHTTESDWEACLQISKLHWGILAVCADIEYVLP